MNKYIFILILCAGMASAGSAQNSLPPPTQKQLADLAAEAKINIRDFMNALKAISSGKLVGESLAGMIKEIEGYCIKNDSIEIIRLSTKVKKTYSLRTYLNDVVPNFRLKWEYVRMGFSNLILNSKAEPLIDKAGKIIGYEMKGSFTQTFSVKKKSDKKESNELDPNDCTISEQTEKTFTAIVSQEVSNTLGTRWIVRLGKIKAVSVVSLKDE